MISNSGSNDSRVNPMDHSHLLLKVILLVNSAFVALSVAKIKCELQLNLLSKKFPEKNILKS